MSCLSDIDLATLHRTRLEERVHYKLSWWTRRLTDKQTNNYCRQSQLNNLNRSTNVTIISQIETQRIENSVVTATTVSDRSRIPAVDESNGGQTNGHCNGHRLDRFKGLLNSVDDNDTSIEVDHFPTLRRRRSGTWP